MDINIHLYVYIELALLIYVDYYTNMRVGKGEKED